MFTLTFWQATLERAVKSFAQSLVAALGAGGAAGWDVPWWSYLSLAAMTALLSVLTSLSSIRVGEAGTPSLLPPSSTVGEGSGVVEPRLART